MATNPSEQAALAPVGSRRREGRPIRILGLTEGNPDTTLSGVARFLFDALQPSCQIVNRLDYGVHGAARMVLAAATFRPSRAAWRGRYHTSRLAHDALTATLRRQLARPQVEFDVALQVHGWTEGQPRPYVLYVDQTRLMAERGYPRWLPLTPRERAEMLERERRMYAGAGHIFTMGTPAGRSVIDDYHVATDRVSVVGGGLMFDRLADVSSPHAGAREPVILFVGREFDRKGGDVLLDAFSAVRRALPAAMLHLVGVSGTLNAPGVVTHGKIASRERIAELYRRSRVFCMPSRYEPYGLAFIEAMAHGVPCVGTEVQSIPEILGGRGGLVVAPNDPASLATGLLALLTDDELARRLGSDGRTMVEQAFRWEHVAARMLPTLETIARVGR